MGCPGRKLSRPTHQQRWLRLKTSTAHRVVVAAQTFRDRPQLQMRARDERNIPMTEVEEMSDRKQSALIMIGSDAGEVESGDRAIHKDGRQALLFKKTAVSFVDGRP